MEGLAPVAAPASPAAPAPAPVAEAPRMRPGEFDSWSSSRAGAELMAPQQPQQPAGQAVEAVAEPMTQTEVADLDQHWTALRSAVKPEHVPELARAMQSGELPASMLGLQVRFTHAGQEVTAPIGELVRGNLRLRDYSRRMNQVREQQERIDATAATITQLFASWDNPVSMLESMRRLEKFPQFEAAAMELARERLREARMTPEQRAAKRAQEAIAARERAINERIAALEARERGAQQSAKTNSIANALAQWAPPAFQRHGIPDIPIAAQWFQSNLDSIWQFGDLTPQLVDDAAALTAEQYREAMRAHTAGAQAAPQQPGAPRALPVHAPAGGATGPAQAQRMRLSDFDDHLKAGRR